MAESDIPVIKVFQYDDHRSLRSLVPPNTEAIMVTISGSPLALPLREPKVIKRELVKNKSTKTRECMSFSPLDLE